MTFSIGPNRIELSLSGIGINDVPVEGSLQPVIIWGFRSCG